MIIASLDQGTLLEVQRQLYIQILVILGLSYLPVQLCTKILKHLQFVYSNVSKHLQRFAVLCNRQHGFFPIEEAVILSYIAIYITLNNFAECKEGTELSISVKHLIKSHMPSYTVPETLLLLWDTWTNIIMALGFSKQWISVHCSSQHEVMQPLYFGLASSISVACVRPRTSNRAGDRPLQLLVFNQEFLVSPSHQLATKTSDIKEGQEDKIFVS